ncbi:hypothetical protein KXQ82_11545 [Mucilaginibacter sp. HMF5004]|uniref:hypothetical protein n=1 Tax=Mucilaginibacter rivuli TaxID=2857527 RepID=UPI001C5FE1FA|nr:hypothetical protein [Mucilaginibacter rivuli]MBW4890358.1 hypothetical protein [Mucilaginibacter rivuli]
MDEIIEEPIPAALPAPEEGGIHLSHFAVYDLQRAAKWAKFLAIIGFICTGFIVIVALFFGTIMSTLSALSPNAGVASAAVGGFVSVIYLILAAVLFTINLFLYQFATRTLNGVALKDKETIEKGIHRLQSFFKAYGIVMIVYLSFLALGLIFAIGMGAMLHH